jgi:hypothetical protein
VKRGQLSVRGLEGIRVRVADPRDDVPVVSRPAGQLKGRAWSDNVQPALGIKRIGEPEEVVLVGAASMVEDEQAGRIAGGEALAGDQ